MSSIFLITGIVLIVVIGLDILIGINNILLLEIIKTLSNALWYAPCQVDRLNI